MAERRDDNNETIEVQHKAPADEHLIPKRKPRKRHKRGRGKGDYAFLVLPALLLIAAITSGIWWYKNTRPMDSTTKYWFDKMAKDGTLEGKTPQEIQGVLDSIIEEGMFNVSINSKVVFENGKSQGNIGMENIPENRYYCRMTLTRDDTGEVLYESQGLKPGQYIDKIRLKKELVMGDYPCTAKIIATDPKTLDDVGQVSVKVLVMVLN